MKNILITLLASILSFISGLFAMAAVLICSDDGYEALGYTRKTWNKR